MHTFKKNEINVFKWIIECMCRCDAPHIQTPDDEKSKEIRNTQRKRDSAEIVFFSTLLCNSM